MMPYEGKEECAVCSEKAVWMEPRFLYLVCETHKNVQPVQIGQLADKKKEQKK